MKIAICDDNASECQMIYNTISAHPAMEEQIFVLYTSASEFIDALSNGSAYDIVFLDVDMPYINGISLGKYIKENTPNTLIVFVTNYPQYAIEAFDCEANGYLIKPLDSVKTRETLDRIVEKHQKLYKNRNSYHIIKIHNRKERLLIKDIYWVKCEKKHIIYMMKNDSRETVGTLSDAYKVLKDYGFYQVHQGYLVNMDKIKKFESYYALLDNGAKVEISVRKRRDFLMAYAKFIEENA